MDAYDTAVLSYALATAANKHRSNLLGMPSSASIGRMEDISLTPPTRAADSKTEEENAQLRNTIYQALCKIEHDIVNKTPIHFQQLMELCLLQQNETQTIVLLDTLQNELRQVCKQGISILVLDKEDDSSKVPTKCEGICKVLLELCNKYDLTEGVNVLKSYLS